MLIPHIGGRYGNLSYFNPAFSSVIEIHSGAADTAEEEETADDGFLDALVGTAAGDWSDEEN